MVKKKVLFVCIGNSCRSPMAEGFARKYGSDVLEVQSAGLAPAAVVQPLTRKVMLDKNINIEDLFPKDFASITLTQFDLIVNISGFRLPTRVAVPVRDWVIEDPIGATEDVYVAVRDEIERMVMQLILETRREAKLAPSHIAPPSRPASAAGIAASDAPPKQRRFLRSR